MPNIQEIVAGIEVELEAVKRRESNARKESEEILERVQREGRSHTTAEEDMKLTELRRARNEAAEQFAGIQAKLARAKAIEAEEIDTESRLNERRRTVPANDNGGQSGREERMHIGSEPRTYNRGRDEARGYRNNPGASFMIDVGAAFLGDRAAGERLDRHMAEERVERPRYFERASSGSTNFAGLVVPQYIVQDAAPYVSAARPICDNMTAKTLPAEGMSVNLSQITTPTAAGIQSSENSALSTQAIDDTLLTFSVQLAGGYIQLSRQAVERGTLTEEITMADLLTRVAVAMETQVIGQASHGLAAVATSQTYTNSTLDTSAVPTFLKTLPQAQNTLDGNLLNRSRPAVVAMNQRRWNWLTAAVSSSWPTLTGTNAVQSGGIILTDKYGPAVRGLLPNGQKVVVSGNVTTVASGTALTGGSQDHVYCFVAEESYLYEPPEKVVTLRAEQPSASSAAIIYVASEYFAYTWERYSGQAVLINGTGCGTPSFA